jgi:hypothetical protein
MQKTRRKRAYHNSQAYAERAQDIEIANETNDENFRNLGLKKRPSQKKAIRHASWYKAFGKAFKNVDQTFVSHSELWDKKNGLPKEKFLYSRATLDKLPIVVDCKRSHFLGMSWKRIGMRPQRIAGANPGNHKLIREEMSGTYSKETLRDAACNWNIVDGSWDTSIAQIQRFADTKTHLLNVNKIFHALNYYAHELILPALDAPCFESVNDLKIKWRAQPGFDQQPSCVNKGQAWVEARADARVLWNYFGLDFRPAVFEWLVGGRWRRNKREFDDKLESRAVLFNCFSMDLINMIYAQPLTMAIKKIDAGANFLGHAMQKLGYERYVAWRRADVYNVDDDTKHIPNVFIAIDAKSHDSSRTYKHKSIVMSIIRSCFPKSKFVDRHFYAITHNLCNLKVVTPGGFTYLFEDGNPSGTPFTSWISTLSNWIDWCCIRFYCPFLRDKDGVRIAIEVIVAGDDTEVKAYVPPGTNVDWGAVAEWAKKNCSLDIPFEEWSFIDVGECKGDLSCHVDTEAISFLKVSVINEVEGTHQIKHLANKDLAPKTVLKKKFQPIDHFFSLLSVHSEDPRLRNFLAKRYFQKIRMRDPIDGVDDRELANYNLIIRNRANLANRSYSIRKFFSFYTRGKHPGRPGSFDHNNGESPSAQLNRMSKNHGFKMFDLLMANDRDLEYEFTGLDARDGSTIESVENSKRFYLGFDARRYPFKAYN